MTSPAENALSVAAQRGRTRNANSRCRQEFLRESSSGTAGDGAPPSSQPIVTPSQRARQVGNWLGPARRAISSIPDPRAATAAEVWLRQRSPASVSVSVLLGKDLSRSRSKRRNETQASRSADPCCHGSKTPPSKLGLASTIPGPWRPGRGGAWPPPRHHQTKPPSTSHRPFPSASFPWYHDSTTPIREVAKPPP